MSQSQQQYNLGQNPACTTGYDRQDYIANFNKYTLVELSLTGEVAELTVQPTGEQGHTKPGTKEERSPDSQSSDSLESFIETGNKPKFTGIHAGRSHDPDPDPDPSDSEDVKMANQDDRNPEDSVTLMFHVLYGMTPIFDPDEDKVQI